MFGNGDKLFRVVLAMPDESVLMRDYASDEGPPPYSYEDEGKALAEGRIKLVESPQVDDEKVVFLFDVAEGSEDDALTFLCFDRSDEDIIKLVFEELGLRFRMPKAEDDG